MKKKDIIALKQKIATFPSVPSVKLLYALAKNLRKINNEIEIIREVEQKTPEFKKYEADRINLCEKYAEKDDKGKAIKEIVNGKEKFKIKDDDSKIFEDEFKKLQELYNEGQSKRFEEDVKIEFHKVKQDDVPKNLEPVLLECILDMIEE